MYNNTNNCVVQVVIPVYNSEKTLRKCLDSVKNQTFKNWQAIISDDASSDNSIKIIEEYIANDGRFVLIKNQQNEGASKARNLALKHLSAEYTAFLDSDDFWEPDMLEIMVSKARELDCDVVQCRFIYDFPNGNQILPKGAFSKNMFLEGRDLKKVFIRMMTGINMNHACIKLIRTTLIKNIEFDTTLPTAEDLDFCVKLFMNVKNYCFITDVLYHYVRSDTSITGNRLPFSARLKSNIRVSKVMAKALTAWNMDNVFYRLLTVLRPYIIIVSKIFRIIREKIVK